MGSYVPTTAAEQEQMLAQVGVKSLKVYFSGYNLLTLFSDLNDIDIDPEGATSGSNIDSYPNVRIFNFGVNITF